MLLRLKNEFSLLHYLRAVWAAARNDSNTLLRSIINLRLEPLHASIILYYFVDNYTHIKISYILKHIHKFICFNYRNESLFAFIGFVAASYLMNTSLINMWQNVPIYFIYTTYVCMLVWIIVIWIFIVSGNAIRLPARFEFPFSKYFLFMMFVMFWKKLKT